MKEITKEQFDALKTTKIHEWHHDYGEDGIYEEWTKVMYNSIFSNIELLAWYDNRIGCLYYIVNTKERETLHNEIAEDIKVFGYRDEY